MEEIQERYDNFFNLFNKTPTYKKFNDDYAEVLDLVLCSPNLLPTLEPLKVYTGNPMGSDHYPIQYRLNLAPLKLPDSQPDKQTFNFKKADW